MQSLQWQTTLWLGSTEILNSVVFGRTAERTESSARSSLLIDFLCERGGGPIYYRGREMLLAQRGMKISESDWNVFLGHAAATLAKFRVPESEQRDAVALVQSLKKDIVE